MVSLFEISTQRPLWDHLTTGIRSLDLSLTLQSDGLYDFQSVPNNSAMYAVVCNLIVSHLQAGEYRKVAVIQTLNPFPWEMLKQHPGFERQWLDQDRIVSYFLGSLPQIFSFFCLDMMKPSRAGSVLTLIMNFHDVIEHYKLQISTAYEEALLKHQIDKNRELIKRKEKLEQEGPSLINLPSLPTDSALRRQHPIIKAQNHITELFKLIGEFSYKYSALVIFLGHLEPQYKLFARRRIAVSMDSTQSQTSFSQSQTTFSHSTSSSSFSFDLRLVLMPVTFGKQSNLDEKQSSIFDLNETKLAARLIFYNDWFFHSPMFLSRKRPALSKERYLVPVVKCSNLSSVANIHEPIFFDFQHNYDIEDADTSENWLIDLLVQPSESISHLIQESLQSTQTMPRAVSTQLSNFPSSSPPLKPHQTSMDTISDLEPELDYRESVLVIDGSDVELTGTLLDDLGEEL